MEKYIKTLVGAFENATAIAREWLPDTQEFGEYSEEQRKTLDELCDKVQTAANALRAELDISDKDVPYQETFLCKGEEEDGSDTVVFHVNVLKKGLDVEDAVRAAIVDYLHTEEGYNRCSDEERHYFDWYNVVDYLPNNICRKHGFEIVSPAIPHDYCVDTQENLVKYNELFFHVTNIQWDTDGQDPDGLNLPCEVDIPFSSLDRGQGLDWDELTDGIADWLSDKYGFCVINYTFD